MPKVWNIGNTTVRNPNRIERALRVFLQEGFSGNSKGAETEARLHLKLKENKILDFIGQASDLNGRKWRAAFYQLGFITNDKYKINSLTLSVKDLFSKLNQSGLDRPYQITLTGSKLISAQSVPEIEEIYCRQFVCYELPNSLESGFPPGKMKPFILFLQVLLELNNRNLDGLNKFETGLFIQPFKTHIQELYLQTVERIIKFRKELNNCSNTSQIKALKKAYLEELEKICVINPLSVVNDYADTTFRYFSLSGLFTRIGETIIIRHSKVEFVKELLKKEPEFLFEKDPLNYFSHFYNNDYWLPIDEKSFALAEIKQLRTEIRNKEHSLFDEIELAEASKELPEIQEVRHKLIVYNGWEREEDYAREQQSESSIRDILRYLKTLNGESFIDKPEIEDKPAYFEWAVWRSFLSINEIKSKVHETRRFPVDHDFLPRNTAPGGGSDLIFEFENFVLAVEVTLTSSHRQMAAESEPVRRHTVSYKEQFPGKDIYCIFIAPTIDNNVAENFRIGVWYNGDEEEFVNIVPMTLSDFNKTIKGLLKHRYKNNDFKNLLDRCLVFRTVRAPQWKERITKEVDEWVKRVCINQ